jgi:hypothetical protein
MNPDFCSYPFVSALKERRSRRFCLGMSLEGGPLTYKSRYVPMPLSETEEALMAFAACGVTGCAVADLAYNNDCGGNIMAGLIGRTIASGDGIQTVNLVTINDSGAYLYRRPQEMPSGKIPELARLSERNEFVQAAQQMRVPIANQRVRTRSEPIFNINANRWSVHAPGTSYFLPVNELTFMYINGLLEILNECTGLYILDERAGFRPAGLAKFAKSKGGHLSDNPVEGKVATIALVERLVTEFVTVEQGMMLQNLGLMAQTLGLGGFPNFANHDFAWFEALGFRMEKMPASKYLGIRGLTSLGMKLLGKDNEVPLPLGLERNGEPLLKCYAPPYFPSMRAAVQAVVDFKFGKNGVFRAPQSPTPWKDATIAPNISGLSDQTVAATMAYCEYVWTRYGRFPAHMPPFRTVLGFQAGHLDLEFYEKFYPPGALGETQRAADSLIEKSLRAPN